MLTCSLCAAPMEDAATACPRCGIAAPGRALPGPRRPGRWLRAAAVSVMGLAVLGTLALPLVRSARGAACEPHGWMAWHAAMERACLTPAYVCENMTSAKLMEDPEVASEVKRALQAGEQGTLAHLEALVGHMRDAYGCDGAAAPDRAEEQQPTRLPPGPPPIPSTPQSPRFDDPPPVTI